MILAMPTVEQTRQRLLDTVGPTLLAQAESEIGLCIPPEFPDEGPVRMDAEAIRMMLIACWLRGWGARAEAVHG